MKRYKLIKNYPHSPKLGTTLLVEDEYLHQNWLFKDYPEFWEEIVEKDYKILSFRHKDQNNKDCIEIDYDKNFKGNEYWDIYSIQRLSDGKIFTIGDSVSILRFGILTITHLFINDRNKILFESYNRKIYKLEDIIEHCELPLFTTEDGKEIFEGDNVYFINTTNHRYNIDIKFNICEYKSHLLYFSTKELAENYILLNKPCLSLKEVEQFYNKLLDFSNNNSKGLKDLVKQKLNL